jgi:hypothetical protein
MIRAQEFSTTQKTGYPVLIGILSLRLRTPVSIGQRFGWRAFNGSFLDHAAMASISIATGASHWRRSG